MRRYSDYLDLIVITHLQHDDDGDIHDDNHQVAASASPAVMIIIMTKDYKTS